MLSLHLDCFMLMFSIPMPMITASVCVTSPCCICSCSFLLGVILLYDDRRWSLSPFLFLFFVSSLVTEYPSYYSYGYLYPEPVHFIFSPLFINSYKLVLGTYIQNTLSCYPTYPTEISILLHISGNFPLLLLSLSEDRAPYYVYR